MPRKPAVIRSEYDRIWDKVWWNRHMSGHATGCNCETEPMVGCDAARVIQKRWGKDALDPVNDIQWGITIGQLTALGWALGAEWEEAGDT